MIWWNWKVKYYKPSALSGRSSAWLWYSSASEDGVTTVGLHFVAECKSSDCSVFSRFMSDASSLLGRVCARLRFRAPRVRHTSCPHRFCNHPGIICLYQGGLRTSQFGSNPSVSNLKMDWPNLPHPHNTKFGNTSGRLKIFFTGGKEGFRGDNYPV